jgi:hypothetical protein
MKEQIQGMETENLHFLTAGRRRRIIVYTLSESK